MTGTLGKQMETVLGNGHVTSKTNETDFGNSHIISNHEADPMT